MKLNKAIIGHIVILLTASFATASIACPDFTGSYVCEMVEGDEEDLAPSALDLVKSNSSYLFAGMVAGSRFEFNLEAGGAPDIQIDDSDFIALQVATFLTCSEKSLKVEMFINKPGEPAKSGLPVTYVAEKDSEGILTVASVADVEGEILDSTKSKCTPVSQPK